MIRIGDTIVYRPGFNSGPPTKAVVDGLTITEHPREKYGNDVSCVDEDLVRKNRVLFSLADGHWCYSEQIDLSKTVPASTPLDLLRDQVQKLYAETRVKSNVASHVPEKERKTLLHQQTVSHLYGSQAAFTTVLMMIDNIQNGK